MRKLLGLLAALALTVSSAIVLAQVGTSPDSAPHNGNAMHQMGNAAAGQMPVWYDAHHLIPGGLSIVSNVRPSSEATYNVQFSDWGKRIVETISSSNPLVNLPNAKLGYNGSPPFMAGWWTIVCSNSSVIGSISATTSTIIDGSSQVALGPGGFCVGIGSDGTNYFEIPSFNSIGMYATYNASYPGLSLQLPDNGTTGGNPRGQEAIDFCLTRSQAIHVGSGNNSFCTGVDNQASGNASMANGQQTRATNAYDFAAGFGTLASGSSSTALGNSTTASGQYSLADGNSTTASASAAVAFGTSATADGVNCIAIGNYAGCKSNIAFFGLSSGNFNNSAGAGEYFVCNLINSTNTASSVQLTSDGGAAGNTNVCAPGNNASMTYTADCAITDQTTHHENTYYFAQSLLVRGNAAANTATGTGNPSATTGPTSPTGSLTLQAIPAIAADTTHGGFNLTYQPPAANTDTIWAICRISGVMLGGN